MTTFTQDNLAMILPLPRWDTRFRIRGLGRYDEYNQPNHWYVDVLVVSQGHLYAGLVNTYSRREHDEYVPASDLETIR